MLGLRTITATEMRVINRSAILELIRRESPISRTAIAKQLEVSLPTVMRIVDQLVDEGLVNPYGDSEWSGGRRRALLAFNSDGQVVVGVDLGAMKMRGAIANLGGKILHEADIQRHTSSGEENFENLARLIEGLLTNSKLENRKVMGIGIGAPSVTYHHDGIISWAPSLNWREYPLKVKLAEQFKLPIIVDNDVNLAVLGEYWFGAAQDARNIVLLAIGTGVGAGILIDGSLYRGAHEASGEIGYILPGREFLGKSFLEFGALEGMASCIGILDRAKQGLKDRLDPTRLNKMTVADVFAAAQMGEDWARKVIDETLDFLAIGIGNIMACYDPDMIILGGEIAQYAESIIEPVLKRIEGALPTQPCLIASKLGSQAVVMGAVANVLHNTSDFYVVQKLT